MNPPFNGMRLSAGAFCQLREAGSEFALSRTFGYANNASGFYDDQWTQLASGVATEPDPNKRKQLYNQINDYLLDQSFGMPLAPSTSRVVSRSSVHGLEFRFNDVMYLGNVWLG